MIYLTRMLGKPVVDADGERIGTISDIAISTGEVFPRVTALAFLGGALVVVGVLLPWLLVLGLLALVAWAVVRRARARRVASTSDAQPVSASAGSDE